MRFEQVGRSPVWRLLQTFSWQELRHQRLRHGVAILAVMLGVALAFAVHLINASALSEFGAAVRAVNGQADLTLHAARGGLDESLYPAVARQADVRVVSPVIDLQTVSQGRPLRILGVDPLLARWTTPALVAQVSHDVIGNDRSTMFDPHVVFLNAQAQRTLGVTPGTEIQVQVGIRQVKLRVAGTVAATGEALGVMDIAGAQEAFDMLGHVTRLDVKLKEGHAAHAMLASLHLPDGVLADTPADTVSQASNMSRAYRVNLTVLALMALFTGAFLVFSTLSLSVMTRQRQFALLGVLGLSARERLWVVLMESLAIGLLGSLPGIALGTGLAWMALSWVGGDLGGDYFVAGSAPALEWSWHAAAVFCGLGVLAAVWGGMLPARLVQRMAPAQALKGERPPERSGKALWAGPLLLTLGFALAFLPAVDGVPVWAYASIVCLMTGGMECVPATVHALLSLVLRVWPRQHLHRHAPAFLALERVRHMRQSATVAIAGIVVSLGLVMALTVMVSSFKSSINAWLDTLLPADLYVRTGLSNGGSDALHLDPAMLTAIRSLPGVKQAMGVRVSKLNLREGLAPVVLIARPLQSASEDPAYRLPLIGPDRPVVHGQVGVYVSEIVADLYGARPGGILALPLRPGQMPVSALVRGVWRDYAHQQGAIIVDQADYQRLTGDMTVNDLAMWLQPGAALTTVQDQVRQVAVSQGRDGNLLIFNVPGDIRKSTLKVFDRSFAVTYWLQAVAIGIGLFGVSASFSGQILARRKEFGLLVHLGLTRRQIVGVLAGEGAALTAVGAIMGLGLGLAVSLVLVYVVNPQSFHWTMDIQLPWSRLSGLCMGMVAAGTATAWLSGHAALGEDVIAAVKEDW